ATCEGKTERANEWRFLFILHRRELDVEKLKWIYIVIIECILKIKMSTSQKLHKHFVHCFQQKARIWPGISSILSKV
ncbi:hypothetical protein CON65_12815, partial [Bacillus pseudomycoides]